MKDKMFVLHKNDLKSVEIAKMLKENGWQEGKDLFITEQREPTWGNIEPEIIDALRLSAQKFKVHFAENHRCQPHTEIISMSEIQKGLHPTSVTENATLMKPDFSHIIGVNIGEESLCQKIETKKDKSAIESVAELIDVELTLEQYFVAANASGGVDLMEKFGKQIWMIEAEREQIMQKIIESERSILSTNLVSLKNNEFIEQFIEQFTEPWKEYISNNINAVIKLDNGLTFVDAKNLSLEFFQSPQVFKTPKQWVALNMQGFLLLTNNTKLNGEKDLSVVAPSELFEEIVNMPETEEDHVIDSGTIGSLDNGFIGNTHWFKVEKLSHSALNSTISYVNNHATQKIALNDLSLNTKSVELEFEHY